MNFCIRDHIFDRIRITDNKLLHFKVPKSGQILCVDRTSFPRPGHISGYLIFDINKTLTAASFIHRHTSLMQ